MDRAYINYAKFEELTDRGVVYVTKMKKSLRYEVLVDCMSQNPKGGNGTSGAGCGIPEGWNQPYRQNRHIRGHQEREGA